MFEMNSDLALASDRRRSKPLSSVLSSLLSTASSARLVSPLRRILHRLLIIPAYFSPAVTARRPAIHHRRRVDLIIGKILNVCMVD